MRTKFTSVLQAAHGWTLGMSITIGYYMLSQHPLSLLQFLISVLYNYLFFFLMQPFVMTKSHSKLLADMLESHSVHDFCLVGPKVNYCCILFVFRC